jgi:Zn-dependent protease
MSRPYPAVMASGWWMHELWERSPVLLASWVFWVLLSVMLHELAHGWVALWQGDDTPRASGHMNFSPLTHMGGTSLIFFVLVGFAWGQMPVSPWRFRMGRMGDVLVSAAGPAMNVLLALVALTGLGIWARHGPAGSTIHDNLQLFLLTGGWLNLFLALFNMLPVPPLDGGTVLAGLVPPLRPLLEGPGMRQFGWIGVFALGMLGFFAPIQSFCRSISLGWASLVAGWVG